MHRTTNTTTMGEDSESESLEIEIGTRRVAHGTRDHELESYLSNRHGIDGTHTPRGDSELEQYLSGRYTKGVMARVEEAKVESVESVKVEENSGGIEIGAKKPRRAIVFVLALLLVLSLAGLGYLSYEYFGIRKEKDKMKEDLKTLRDVKAENQNLEHEIAKMRLELQASKLKLEEKQNGTDIKKLETLQKDLTESRKEIETLEITRVQAEKENLEIEFAKICLEFQALRGTHKEEIDAKMAHAQVKIDKLQEENADLLDQMSRISAEKDRMKEESLELLAIIAHKERQVNEERANYEWYKHNSLESQSCAMKQEDDDRDKEFKFLFDNDSLFPSGVGSEVLTIIGSLSGRLHLMEIRDSMSTIIHGHTPLALAILNNRKEVVEYFREKYLKADSGRTSIIKELKLSLGLQKLYPSEERYHDLVGYILTKIIGSDRKDVFRKLVRDDYDLMNAIDTIPAVVPE